MRRHLEAQNVAIERQRAVEVADRQMYVANSGAGVDAHVVEKYIRVDSRPGTQPRSPVRAMSPSWPTRPALRNAASASRRSRISVAARSKFRSSWVIRRFEPARRSTR